jgi:hypothetical protein
MTAITKRVPATKIKGVSIDQSQYGTFVDSAATQPFWDDGKYVSGTNIMYGIEGPDYSENPFDCISLGGNRLPGIWSATAKPSVQIDIQKPQNYDGAALIIRGYNPAKNITLTGRIWTPSQWEIYQKIAPTFWAKPNKISAQTVVLGKGGKVGVQQEDKGQIVGQQKALSIVCPALNAAPISIHTIVIQAPSSPEPDGVAGVMKIALIAIEYVAEPQAAKSATKQIKGNSDRGEDAITAAIREGDARKAKSPGSGAAGGPD